jgi:hypothetical protein
VIEYLRHVLTLPPFILGTTVTLDVKMAPQVPTFFTGTWNDQEPGGKVIWTTAFNESVPMIDGKVSNFIVPDMLNNDNSTEIVKHFYREAAMAGVARGCHGECKFKLRAPALGKTCLTEQFPVNYSSTITNAQLGSFMALDKSHLAYIASAGVIETGESEEIYVISGYARNENCAGNFTYTACTLRSAIGEYDATVSHGLVTLDSATPRILQLSNNTPVSNEIIRNDQRPSTLAIVAFLGYSKWMATTWIYMADDGSYQIIAAGPGTSLLYVDSLEAKCQSFSDPMEDMLNGLNRAMVYTGMVAARQDPAYLKSHMDPGYVHFSC